MTSPLLRGFLLGVLAFGAFRAGAQEPAVAPPAEPSLGYEQGWKATFAAYSVDDHLSGDINLRRKLGAFDVWLGAYLSRTDGNSVRVGADWTFESRWFRATPAVALTSDGFVGGQVYTEIGPGPYLIAGYSQTNEKPYFNLTFDPNESVQLGAGAKLGKDWVSASTIFDVRLGTGQQDTHVTWRRWLEGGHRLTLDAVYKSGHTDGGEFVRGAGLTVTYDWAWYFVRVAYDPYVNFTDDAMWRLAAGLRF